MVLSRRADAGLRSRAGPNAGPAVCDGEGAGGQGFTPRWQGIRISISLDRFISLARFGPNRFYLWGCAAYHERRYAEAEEGWTNALRHYRDLATRDGGAYRPYVAGTLNNLAVLYSATGRLAEAEKAYDEALTIYRDLATRNPAVYVSKVKAVTETLAKFRK